MDIWQFACNIVAPFIPSSLAPARGRDDDIAPGVVAARIVGGIGHHILGGEHDAQFVDDAAEIAVDIVPQTTGLGGHLAVLGIVRADHVAHDTLGFQQIDHRIGGIGRGPAAALAGLMIAGIGDEDENALADRPEGESSGARQPLERIFRGIPAARGVEAVDPPFEGADVGGEIVDLLDLVPVGDQGETVIDTLGGEGVGKGRSPVLDAADRAAHAAGGVENKYNVGFGAGGDAHRLNLDRRFPGAILAHPEIFSGELGDRFVGDRIDDTDEGFDAREGAGVDAADLDRVAKEVKTLFGSGGGLGGGNRRGVAPRAVIGEGAVKIGRIGGQKGVGAEAPGAVVDDHAVARAGGIAAGVAHDDGAGIIIAGIIPGDIDGIGTGRRGGHPRDNAGISGAPLQLEDGAAGAGSPAAGRMDQKEVIELIGGGTVLLFPGVTAVIGLEDPAVVARDVAVVAGGEMDGTQRLAAHLFRAPGGAAVGAHQHLAVLANGPAEIFVGEPDVVDAGAHSAGHQLPVGAAVSGAQDDPVFARRNSLVAIEEIDGVQAGGEAGELLRPGRTAVTGGLDLALLAADPTGRAVDHVQAVQPGRAAAQDPRPGEAAVHALEDDRILFTVIADRPPGRRIEKVEIAQSELRGHIAGGPGRPPVGGMKQRARASARPGPQGVDRPDREKIFGGRNALPVPGDIGDHCGKDGDIVLFSDHVFPAAVGNPEGDGVKTRLGVGVLRILRIGIDEEVVIKIPAPGENSPAADDRMAGRGLGAGCGQSHRRRARQDLVAHGDRPGGAVDIAYIPEEAGTAGGNGNRLQQPVRSVDLHLCFGTADGGNGRIVLDVAAIGARLQLPDGDGLRPVALLMIDIEKDIGHGGEMALVFPIDFMAHAADDRRMQMQIEVLGLAAPIEDQPHLARFDDRRQRDLDILVLALGEGENGFRAHITRRRHCEGVAADAGEVVELHQERGLAREGFGREIGSNDAGRDILDGVVSRGIGLRAPARDPDHRPGDSRFGDRIGDAPGQGGIFAGIGRFAHGHGQSAGLIAVRARDDHRGTAGGGSSAHRNRKFNLARAPADGDRLGHLQAGGFGGAQGDDHIADGGGRQGDFGDDALAEGNGQLFRAQDELGVIPRADLDDRAIVGKIGPVIKGDKGALESGPVARPGRRRHRPMIVAGAPIADLEEAAALPAGGAPAQGSVARSAPPFGSLIKSGRKSRTDPDAVDSAGVARIAHLRPDAKGLHIGQDGVELLLPDIKPAGVKLDSDALPGVGHRRRIEGG